MGPTGSSCTSVLPHVKKKYCWASDDNNTEQWYAQGVSSTYDAYGGAGTTAGGRSLLATSWYDHDGGTNKGARVSLLNRATAKYRHVLLAVPTGTASSPSFTIANTHAGGLAWYGRYLYVADTSGIRVFDMARMWRVNTDISGSIGRTSSGYGAYGYKYVAPQVHRYARQGTFRYSSIAIDRTTSPDTLVATEYRAPGDTSQASPRTVRYNLNESTKAHRRERLEGRRRGRCVEHRRRQPPGWCLRQRAALPQPERRWLDGGDRQRPRRPLPLHAVLELARPLGQPPAGRHRGLQPLGWSR